MPLVKDPQTGTLFTIDPKDLAGYLARMSKLGLKPEVFPLVKELAPQPEASIQYALDRPTNELEAKNYDAVTHNMRGLLRVPVVRAAAVMPDACPAGPGITVGGIIETENAIIPSAHSEDICCSMMTTFFPAIGHMTPQAVLNTLQRATHFGSGGRETPIHDSVLTDPRLSENLFLRSFQGVAASHLGTQGDGNHFANVGSLFVTPEFIESLHEAGYYEYAGYFRKHVNDTVYALTTHHGSRGFGAQVYREGQKAAKEFTRQIAPWVPPHAAWLQADTAVGKAYWDALQYIGDWTRSNHRVIHRDVLRDLGLFITGSSVTIHNQHNFVWRDGSRYAHGKGATPAGKDRLGRPHLGIIPLNMASPILLVLGRDNKQFLSFAPHGAGRNQSRTATLAPFKTDSRGISPREAQRVVEEQTAGLDIRWWNGKPDISETPMAYKPAGEIIRQIEQYDLANVIAQIQPLGGIMAGDSPAPPWLRKKRKNNEQKDPESTKEA